MRCVLEENWTHKATSLPDPPNQTFTNHVLDKPITSKPLEVRQGKGKGSVEYWVAQVQPGKVLYEMDGVPETIAREAFNLAARKLPIKTTFVIKAVM